jgi:predicted CXXCH cytochrome family protein
VLPGASVPGNLRDSPTYSVHRPFLEERCGDCHTSRFRLEAVGADVCLKCHASATGQYPHVHGPVAAGACLWCHVPHESAYAHLFKGEARGVCTQCHDPSLMKADRVPAHADEHRDCLECHAGHGGLDRYFLTDGGSAGPPAPREK